MNSKMYTGTNAEDGHEIAGTSCDMLIIDDISHPEPEEPEKVYTPEEIKVLKKKYQPLRELKSSPRQFRKQMCELHGVSMKNWRKIEKFMSKNNIPMEDYLNELRGAAK